MWIEMTFVNTGGRDRKNNLFTGMSLSLFLKVIFVRLSKKRFFGINCFKS